MKVLNSFHEPLLPIGTILMYKRISVEIIEYDGWHDGFADYYVIQPVDLVEVLEKFKEEGEGLSYPKASAQKMVLSTGSQAILDSADAEEILLPILGELKILITDNQLLFDQAPEIQRLLEDFIRETEIEAELPWMTFTWDNKVKSKKVQVKFIFSDTPYTLLSYYTHTKGRSGMRDVIESLLKKYC